MIVDRCKWQVASCEFCVSQRRPHKRDHQVERRTLSSAGFILPSFLENARYASGPISNPKELGNKFTER